MSNGASDALPRSANPMPPELFGQRRDLAPNFGDEMTGPGSPGPGARGDTYQIAPDEGNAPAPTTEAGKLLRQATEAYDSGKDPAGGMQASEKLFQEATIAAAKAYQQAYEKLQTANTDHKGEEALTKVDQDEKDLQTIFQALPDHKQSVADALMTALLKLSKELPANVKESQLDDTQKALLGLKSKAEKILTADGLLKPFLQYQQDLNAPTYTQFAEAQQAIATSASDLGNSFDAYTKALVAVGRTSDADAMQQKGMEIMLGPVMNQEQPEMPKGEPL